MVQIRAHLHQGAILSCKEWVTRKSINGWVCGIYDLFFPVTAAGLIETRANQSQLLGKDLGNT